ncbi:MULTISPECIES: ketopantoate reductase family protein [Acinetobacter]|jgi:2-dehydropantoate 2-reductase|uniref:2-dehydropantoate 2-reductase n=2 Tax=Acinetobacter pittii TaxID=48296 RepID=A0A242U406_ACIPI|nr:MULTISPECIES: ketopantoate reductase family protein [Acinetobacter]MBJ8499676.1 ketopantoate reductase family protein [Acinetobacter pittii]MBJ9893701.1 ketopantoate reductase family protein [Acinetobacter pittii]MCU4476960.1 ketopantoate reductase family protein [Acinetobacter sp. WU_MDCI_Abxd143]MDN4022239.1 ketopantoate reductase family protein [Acinetobacter pittii]OTU25974.1 2-dehydropantoate 2-reductase [Acinetobacter pittii]
MKTAIYGIGSLGTIIGALLTKQGYEVDLIDPYSINVEALKKNGARVTGNMDVHVAVKAFTPDELTDCYDLIILLTKQTTNQEEIPKLLPYLHENSVICSLQNGIPEPSIAKIIGQNKTVGGVVGFGATWLSPGVSELTSTAEVVENFAFEIGEIDGQITPRIQKIQQILSLIGHTTILPNLMGIRWSKLLMNATFSGMSAALGCTFGEVLDNDRAMICLSYIADETVKVCHAAGYDMVEMNGINMGQLELYSYQDIVNKLPIYQKVWGVHRRSKASMLQDLEKQRPCEIDFINGVVSQVGKSLGISTPFNDKVIELVKSAERRKGVNNFSYLSQFDELINHVKAEVSV